MNAKNRSIEEPKLSESVQFHLHYLDHFTRIEENEELQSEQRMKFFLVLISGAITIFSGLYKFGTTTNTDFPYSAFLILLLFLFTIGLFVFARVIWSDRKIKMHRKLSERSYDTIKSIDPSVVCYIEQLSKMDDSFIFKPMRIFKGTLTQIMWITEGMLAAGFVYVLGISQAWSICQIVWSSSVTTVIILVLLFWWSRYIKRGIN